MLFGALLVTLAVTQGAWSLADVFTAEDMLTTPRPQDPILSADREHAIQAVDVWDAKSDVMTRSVYLLSMSSPDAAPIELLSSPPGEASEFIWIENSGVVYLNGSSLYALENHPPSLKPSTHILDFPEGINPTGLRYHSEHILFSGQVWRDDEDFDTVKKQDEVYESRRSSAMIYDSLFVRHWDTWRHPGKIWTLGSISLETHKVKNLLKGLAIHNRADPIDFTTSSNHIAFSLKNVHLEDARHTRMEIYMMTLTHSPYQLSLGEHGAVGSLTFSPDGKKLAFAVQKLDGYESDYRTIKVYNPESRQYTAWNEDADQSATQVVWSLDSESLYMLSEHHGRILPYHISHPGYIPKPLDFDGATTFFAPLKDESFLTAKSTVKSPSDVYLLAQGKMQRITNWADEHINGRLDAHVGEEYWFKGTDGLDVMAWIIKPRGWKEGSDHKYPMAFLIHGGPQGAWEDAWSTRWNPTLWASAGYFVVAINPTGSTGYGQDFVDRITGYWGDRPFKDLLAGYHSVLEHYPEIDPQRTAALGASYGGYMANWIQGHNQQFGFKAIVCHDGIFSTTGSYYTTDELYFYEHDHEGAPFENRLLSEKWNPMNHVSEWKTPQLVIHSGKDYRLVDGEGLAAFTALQRQGVPSRFLYFPDENHWVLKPHNSIVWHHEVFRWLEEWTGAESKQNSQDFVVQH